MSDGDRRTVNVEVYHDGGEVFAVASEHRPDLPKPFGEPLQEWAKENYSHLDGGDSIKEAGEVEYVPCGEIVEIRKVGA